MTAVPHPSISGSQRNPFNSLHGENAMMTRQQADDAHDALNRQIAPLQAIYDSLKAQHAALVKSGVSDGCEAEQALDYLDSEIKGMLRDLTALPAPDECPETLSRRSVWTWDSDFHEELKRVAFSFVQTGPSLDQLVDQRPDEERAA